MTNDRSHIHAGAASLFAGLTLACAAALLLFSAPPAIAGPACGASSSGLSMPSANCKKIKKARLVRGKAIPPKSAPRRVKKVIRAANRIRNKPYIYGGGHGSFRSRGYDCSGSVSYALHGGRFVRTPMASGSYMRWKRRGKGKWITVYSNPGHMYMIVAGLRFDTSMTPGNGPGWSRHHRSTPGRFSARHPGRF